MCISVYRQATEEPLQEVPRYRQGQGPQEEQELNVTAGPTLVLMMRGVGFGDGRGLFLSRARNGSLQVAGTPKLRCLWIWICGAG